MRRPFLIRSVLILGVGLALVATPAAAQWRHDGGHGHRAGSDRAPAAFDWRSQLDRPGDYRCDVFWDANRTDCDARWRDQRHRASPQARRDYSALAGHDDYGLAFQGGRYSGWYSTRRRGYGGYSHGPPAGTAYHGAYGRPDLVYPGGGHRGYGGSPDADRIDWCRATYRSYDPGSGYYRAWSGRLIFCG